MTTEHLKNWIKAQDADFKDCIRLGGIDGNSSRFLGVYPSNSNGRQHIAIGGPSCTSYGTFDARLLLRWGKSQPEAERKAKALWGLFFGRTGYDMDGVRVSYADPGVGPIPIGKGVDSVFEYMINLNIIYMKE